MPLCYGVPCELHLIERVDHGVHSFCQHRTAVHGPRELQRLIWTTSNQG